MILRCPVGRTRSLVVLIRFLRAAVGGRGRLAIGRAVRRGSVLCGSSLTGAPFALRVLARGGAFLCGALIHAALIHAALAFGALIAALGLHAARRVHLSATLLVELTLLGERSCRCKQRERGHAR